MIISASAGITPEGLIEKIWIRVENGFIEEIGKGEIDSSDVHLTGTLIPGFVDIHCHGGGGYYFSDSNTVNIQRAINLHRLHGTTFQVASLVTDSVEALHSQIKRLLPFIRDGWISGIHLEGPYLSKAKCGAHNSELLRVPEVTEIKGFLEIGEGAISMVTIAPELPGAIEAISYLSSQGVIAAIGHTNANPNQMELAIAAGASVVTHFNNAMQKLDSSDKSSAHYLLDNEVISLEAIFDGVHLQESVEKSLLKDFNSRTIAVTDAMSAAGCGDGNYLIGNLPVVVRNDVARLEDGGALAGSTLTMDRVFLNLVHSGATLEDAVLMTSQNAADLLGIHQIGRIEVGAIADLLEYQKDGVITRVELPE